MPWITVSNPEISDQLLVNIPIIILFSPSLCHLMLTLLSPSTNIHILLNVLGTFLMVLVGRICLNIRKF